jgi:hypothetical protein
MRNAVFWDVAPRGSCVNRRFLGTYHLHLQGTKIRERATILSRWLQTELSSLLIFHVDQSPSLPPSFYTDGCFRLAAQSAATCSRWVIAGGFFYRDDGGDTFFRNVGSQKNYTTPRPRKRHSSNRLEIMNI